MILPLIGDVLRSAWPWVEGQLARRPIAYTPEQLRNLAERGHLTVWAVILDDQPVAVVMLLKSADGEGEIVYGAGERMSECLDEVIEAAKQWCEWNDCHTLMVDGRKGWARVLAKYGFEHEDKQWAALRLKTKR